MLIASVSEPRTNEQLIEVERQCLDELMNEAGLSGRQRQVIDRHLHHLNQREIARTMGLPERLILKDLVRAYTKLRAVDHIRDTDTQQIEAGV